MAAYAIAFHKANTKKIETLANGSVAPQDSLKADEKVVAPVVIVPSQVNKTYLYSNQKLLSEDQIKLVTDQLKNQASGIRYPKSDFEKHGVPYAILKGESEHYAIYNEVDDNNAIKQFELGSGSYGAVKLVQRLRDGKWFALKTQVFDRVGDGIRQEYLKGKELNKVSDVIFARKQKSKAGLTKLEFITEYEPGLDFHELRKKVRFSEVALLRIVVNLLAKYINVFFDNGYIHRDLKLENLMVEAISQEVNWIDYLFLVKCDQAEVIQEDGCVGTPHYLAPESANKFQSSLKSDTYALGILIREILFNQSIELSGGQRFFEQLQPLTSYFRNLDLINFINRMYASDPSQRPSIEEIWKHFSTLLATKDPSYQPVEFSKLSLKARQAKSAVEAKATAAASPVAPAAAPAAAPTTAPAAAPAAVAVAAASPPIKADAKESQLLTAKDQDKPAVLTLSTTTVTKGLSAAMKPEAKESMPKNAVRSRVISTPPSATRSKLSAWALATPREHAAKSLTLTNKVAAHSQNPLTPQSPPLQGKSLFAVKKAADASGVKGAVAQCELQLR